MKRTAVVISLTVVFFVLAAVFISTHYMQNTDEASRPADIGGSMPSSAGVKISAGKSPDIPFTLPEGLSVHVFAEDLGSPRDLVFSPGGTLLISDPSGRRVIALPDADKNGQADRQVTVFSGGSNMHGLAFFGSDKLFVAEERRIIRLAWDEKNLRAVQDKVILELPGNNNHNKRTVAIDAAGNLYVSVGSTCNVCTENDKRSGTVMVTDTEGNNPRIYATGLRNAPFLKLHPVTGDLWATEMGRDYLGDNLPPDEINIIREGNDYGWPYCYGNKVSDSGFNDSNAGRIRCESTEPPVYEIPAHNAPLGLEFIRSAQFPPDWENDLLVAYHGSWNSSTPVGYKIVHLKVSDNRITASDDFLTGFLQGETVLGRPADLAFDASGNLYVSDDNAGMVYIIQKEG